MNLEKLPFRINELTCLFGRLDLRRFFEIKIGTSSKLSFRDQSNDPK